MEPALAIFGMLLGQCWAAEVAPQTLDTHCFADLWNGSHVRDRHSVTRDGKAIYEGETIYSFDGKSIVFTYVNSLGGVGRGNAKVDGRTVGFSGSMLASPGAPPQPIDSRWRLLDASYEVVNAGGPNAVVFRPIVKR